ncbi:MAG TPA: ATP-binding protein [Anaerolineae bacterium]
MVPSESVGPVPGPAREGTPRYLRRRLAAWYGGSLSLMLLLFVAATLTFTYRTEIGLWEEHQQHIADAAAAKIAAVTDRADHVLRFVGLPGRDVLKAAPRIVDDLLDQDPDLLEIVRVDAHGAVNAAVYRDLAILADGANLAAAEWFRQAQAGIHYLGTPEYPAGGRPYVISAQRTLDGDVVAVRLDLGAVDAAVAGTRFGEQGRTYLIDGSGRMISDGALVTARSTQAPAGLPQLAAILAAPGYRWHDQTRTRDGIRVLSGSSGVPGTTWIAVTELPVAEALGTSWQILLIMVPAALLVGAVIILMTMGVIRRLIFRPLDQLRLGAQRLGSGESDFRLGFRREDEIGQVASAFDRMADQLAERGQALTGQNVTLAGEVEERKRVETELQRANDSLEARVSARTIELLETNSRLEFELAERRRAEERSTAFVRLGQQLNSTSSAEEAARIIVQVADELLGWDACYLDLYLSDEQLFLPVLEIDIIDGRRTELPVVREAKLPTAIMQQALLAGGRLFFADDPDGFVENAPRFGDVTRATTSIIAVPIRHGVRTIGVLSIQSYVDHAYTSAALETLQGLADHCGGALERMSAEKVLQEYTAQLEKTNRELQEFDFVASHDLQEPLRKVQTFGDLLQEKYATVLDEPGQDYIQRMQNAAARMQVLIEGLLTYSRVTTKAQPFARVDLDEVAREVLGDLETHIAQVGGQIEIDPLGAIDADALQMRQLMQNLIGNSLKFHREGVPPVVHVWAERQASASTGDGHRGGEPVAETQCLIMVEDNGIGFEEKYTERIFQVFQRLHGRSVYAGAGIGLAVCRKIAERHGGSITARSAPGQGSTFVVSLPASHNLV